MKKDSSEQQQRVLRKLIRSQKPTLQAMSFPGRKSTIPFPVGKRITRSNAARNKIEKEASSKVSPTIKFDLKQSDDGSKSSDSQSELQKQNTNVHTSKINDNQSDPNSTQETVEEKSAKKPRKKRISRTLFRHDTIDYIKPKKQELLQNNFSFKFQKLVDKSKGIYSENEEQVNDDEIETEKTDEFLDTTKTVSSIESNNNMSEMQQIILDMPSLDSPNTGKNSNQNRNDNKNKSVSTTPINIKVEVSQKAKNDLQNIALQNAQITKDKKSSQHLQYKYVGIVPRQNTTEKQKKQTDEQMPQYTITIVPDAPKTNERDNRTVPPPNYPQNYAICQPANNAQYRVVENQAQQRFPHNINRYPYPYAYGYPYPIIQPAYENTIWNPITTESSNKYNIENLIHKPENATITTQNTLTPAGNYKMKHNLSNPNYIHKPVAQNKNYANIISNEIYIPKVNSNHTITKPQIHNVSSVNYTLDRDKIGANIHYNDNKTQHSNCILTKEPTNHKLEQVIKNNTQNEQSAHKNLHTVQNILHRNANYIPVPGYNVVNLQQNSLPNQQQGQKRNSEQVGSKINYKRVRFDSNLPTKNSLLPAINYATSDKDVENNVTSKVSEIDKNNSTESVIVSPKEKKNTSEQVTVSTENNKTMQGCSVIKKICSQNKNTHTIENILSIQNLQNKNEINNNNTIIEPHRTVINYSETKKVENEPIIVDLTTDVSENNSDKEYDRPMPELVPVPKGYLNKITKQDTINNQRVKNYASNVPYIKPAHGYKKPIETANDILPLNLSLKQDKVKESDKINENSTIDKGKNEQHNRQSIIVNNVKSKDPLDLSTLTFVKNEDEYNNYLKLLKETNAVGPYLFYNFIASVRKRNNQPIFDLVTFFSLLKQGKLLEYKNMYMQHNK